MQSLMQDDWPLVVTKIIDFAAKFHAEQEIISKTVEGPVISLNYKQLRDRSAQCSLALLRLGVQPGQRVATLAWNTSRHMECWYGIAGIGAICHTLNPRLFDDDLEYIVNHAEDSIIMADISFADLLLRLTPKLHTVKHYIFLTEDKFMPKSAASVRLNAMCYEDLLDAEAERVASFSWDTLMQTRDIRESHACGLCYTSGTTGKPKGVLYSHRSNFLHAMTICLPDGLDIKSTSTFLMIVPMFHANSWGIAFGAPMVGARLVLPGPALDGHSVHSMIQSYRVTHTAGVPTVWLGLMEHMNNSSQNGMADSMGLKSLSLMIVGGSACPRVLIDFFEMKHGVEVRQLWGMTELSPCGTVGALKPTPDHSMQGTLIGSLTKENAISLKLKQGRPHVFQDMRIVDHRGKELPHDGATFGTLQVRGPCTVRRYYKFDKDAVDEQGWFDTGDVSTIDEYGHMQITDRSKDVIKSGGEWISSVAIENEAVGHPGVKEAAVIGIPDKKWGERPLLIIVPQDNNGESGFKGSLVSKDEILSFLQGKIARWWMPDDIAFVKEIPHTATGKISKLMLREHFKEYSLKSSKL